MRLVSLYSLEELMDFPLPSITYQKRLMYRPSKNDVYHTYELLNYYIFNNDLKIPKIHLAPRCRKYWGMCLGEVDKHNTGSYCEIRLMDKWFCPQWMITTLAHEMVHQHQWDIEGPKRYRRGKDHLMSHGPTFFKFRQTMNDFNIPLKTAHSMRRWFKHQNIFKC